MEKRSIATYENEFIESSESLRQFAENRGLVYTSLKQVSRKDSWISKRKELNRKRGIKTSAKSGIPVKKQAKATSGKFTKGLSVPPGEPIEKSKPTFYIPKHLMKQLKHLAVDEEKTLSDLASEAIKLLLKKYGR